MYGFALWNLPTKCMPCLRIRCASSLLFTVVLIDECCCVPLFAAAAKQSGWVIQHRTNGSCTAVGPAATSYLICSSPPCGKYICLTWGLCLSTILRRTSRRFDINISAVICSVVIPVRFPPLLYLNFTILRCASNFILSSFMFREYTISWAVELVALGASADRVNIILHLYSSTLFNGGEKASICAGLLCLLLFPTIIHSMGFPPLGTLVAAIVAIIGDVFDFVWKLGCSERFPWFVLETLASVCYYL